MTFRINGLYLKDKKPDVVLAGCIEIFENAWPSNPQNTINDVESQVANLDSGVYWKKAPTIGLGDNQDYRKNMVLDLTYMCDITDNSIIQNIHNQYYSMLLSASNSYATRLGINEHLYHEGYQMLKYSNGQDYRAHYDGATDDKRCISAICYLNNDYVGGEIEFVNFGIKIKPEPGMLILFPSNYAYKHIAHPVTEGTKYAIVTWIRDRA